MEVTRQVEVYWWSLQVEAKELGKREDKPEKNNTIATKIGKVISMRQRCGGNKDRKIYINEENILRE